MLNRSPIIQRNLIQRLLFRVLLHLGVQFFLFFFLKSYLNCLAVRSQSAADLTET